MKLLIGAFGSTQFIQAVQDDADLHRIIRELVVGGKRPDIFTVIPLPLVGRNIFISGRVFAEGREANLTMTLGNDSSQSVTINSASDYINFVEYLKVLLATQQGHTLLYLYSIAMF